MVSVDGGRVVELAQSGDPLSAFEFQKRRLPVSVIYCPLSRSFHLAQLL